MRKQHIPYLVGSGLILVWMLVAISAASKPPIKAPQKPMPPQTPPRPLGTVLQIPEQLIDQGSGNLPLDVVNDLAKVTDPETVKAQSTWLRDQGYTMTADALLNWLDDDLSIDALREIARSEGVV